MSRIEVIKESIEKTLKDENKPWVKLFAFAEEKTGINRLYLFVGFIVIFSLYLLIGVGQQLVCNIIGFVYPAYYSMKALESPKKDDDSKWLTYWIVFALFTIIEFFSEFIVCWLPFYWLLKCIFYIWLMAPMEYNGSLIIYRRIVRPKFLQYHPHVDKFLSNARDNAIKATVDAVLADKRD
ncbi:receptor expression-enhancing protein 5-like [Vespa velutina]|uniref:receptor expression-enhancing protein 5-like n=1 Tax=Vespa velutina TaxID=202808 RepID=UPI001FB4349F|nr:receptor expression-enhancing protein 5-like [Vespa velutina]